MCLAADPVRCPKTTLPPMVSTSPHSPASDIRRPIETPLGRDDENRPKEAPGGCEKSETAITECIDGGRRTLKPGEAPAGHGPMGLPGAQEVEAWSAQLVEGG